MLTFVKNIHRNYFDSFKNLSREVWWLALVTFVNRAGTMIIPFLTLYLTDELGFSLAQVGWIMVSFGAGSVAGSWIGGKLTDRYGFYRVMTLSLLATGFLFILLQWVRNYYFFLLAIFLVMTIADSFRPAIFVALKNYSKAENQTRSVTLIRLAINLGFSMGPALGGMIISFWGYSGLFWIDGITCILSFIIFIITIKEVIISTDNESISGENKSPEVYRDAKFLLFIFVSFLMGFVFMQLFSTVPIFYRDVFRLDEGEIGLLLALNGMVIFFFEMPLVHKLELLKVSKVRVLQFSLLLIALSYFILNINGSSVWILIISMLFVAVGEMLGFPFTNAIAMNAGAKDKAGSYMALYTMSFSVAHLLSAKLGLLWIESYGFYSTWYIVGVIALIALLISFKLKY